MPDILPGERDLILRGKGVPMDGLNFTNGKQAHKKGAAAPSQIGYPRHSPWFGSIFQATIQSAGGHIGKSTAADPDSGYAIPEELTERQFLWNQKCMQKVSFH